jgi:hypothetical protein
MGLDAKGRSDLSAAMRPPYQLFKCMQLFVIVFSMKQRKGRAWGLKKREERSDDAMCAHICYSNACMHATVRPYSKGGTWGPGRSAEAQGLDARAPCAVSLIRPAIRHRAFISASDRRRKPCTTTRCSPARSRQLAPRHTFRVAGIALSPQVCFSSARLRRAAAVRVRPACCPDRAEGGCWQRKARCFANY